MFVDEWSKYLVKHLPKDKPIVSFKELDEWVDGIWETFYNEHEERAKEGDGILLNKFYNEGSCATIAAAWKIQEKVAKWMAYGDSVVFHYSFQTGILEHSLRNWQISVILQDWLVAKTRWKKKALNMVNLC